MTSTDTGANVTPESDVSQRRWVGVYREPRAAALGCVAGYLAVTGVLLARAGPSSLMLLHVAGIALACWCLVSRSVSARRVGDVLPLVSMPALYGEIPSLITAAGSSYHDAAVQGWEAILFGGQPSHLLASRLPYTGLSELVHAGYLAYYPAIFLPPLLLYVRREHRGFSQTVLVLTVTYAVCWLGFVFFPVEGPRYLWPAPLGVPDGPMRRLAVWLLAAGSSRGAAFPSSHMAVMVAQTAVAFRWQRRSAWLLAVGALLVGIGAVYGGFHYATDIVAGAVVGGLCAMLILISTTRVRRAGSQ